jgi:hypothetical protein
MKHLGGLIGPTRQTALAVLVGPHRLGVGATASLVRGAKRYAASSIYSFATGSTSVKTTTTPCAGAATGACAELGRTEPLDTTCAALASQNAGIPAASHATRP